MWGLRTLLAPNGFQKREEKSYYILLYWEESCKSHLRQKKNRLYMWFSEFELSKKKKILGWFAYSLQFTLSHDWLVQYSRSYISSLWIVLRWKLLSGSGWILTYLRTFFSLTSWSRFPDGFFIYLFSSIYCAIKILVNHNKLCLTVQTYIVQIEIHFGD